LFGINIEKFSSDKNFYPGAQSVYVYNSLDDFYKDANDFLSHPARTASPINLRLFQYRYSNIPGMDTPILPLRVFYGGLYMQDKWDIANNVRLTFGIRVDIPFFEATGLRNIQVEGLNFKDEVGNKVNYSTSKMPDANPLYSPRFGFNWDLMGNKTTQLRGGTGIFTGQPAFVWLSNQVGNNGILTGYQNLTGTESTPLYGRPFNPAVDAYKPAKVNGEPASTYELALTDPKFRFPQIWRSNIAIDQVLPFDLIGTIDLMYDHDINGISFINANLSDPATYYNGPDQRPRWTNGNRINSNIDNAVVLKNQNKGFAWNIAASLERRFKNGLYWKVGYSYGVSKNTVEPISIASATWLYNAHSGNPNQPDVSYSIFSPGHRFFSALSYESDIFQFGSSSVSLFLESSSNGRVSYIYAGDMNGDGGTSNDLIYIPKDKSEMYFQQYTTGGKTYTVSEQQDAWEKFIGQDRYLNSRRGKYAERLGVELPLVTRLDASIRQTFQSKFFGKGNRLILRLDIMNLTNFLNKHWGVGQTLLTSQPLIAQSPTTDGYPVYRLQAINSELITKSFINTANLADVYKMQLSIKWLFNQ
jgi:hypothetical protein